LEEAAITHRTSAPGKPNRRTGFQADRRPALAKNVALAAARQNLASPSADKAFFFFSLRSGLRMLPISA
jgi:hypothetical protein